MVCHPAIRGNKGFVDALRMNLENVMLTKGHILDDPIYIKYPE